jgi:hypothetical protein
MNREQQLQARDVDRISTALIDLGVTVIKRNPVPTALYVIGKSIYCPFFLYGGVILEPASISSSHNPIRYSYLPTFQWLQPFRGAEDTVQQRNAEHQLS